MTNTLTFLQRLYANVDRGWLTLFAIDRRDGRHHVGWFPVTDLAGMVETATALNVNCCVWYGVATREAHLGVGRGKASDCELVPALWVDIDVAGPNHASPNLPADDQAAMRLLAWCPEEPDITVHTGGGLQAYWLYDEPQPAGTVGVTLALEALAWERWAKAEGVHIDNVFDVSRVLRLPGTYNLKNPDQPQPVHIIAERP